MVPTGVGKRWSLKGIQTQPTKHCENLAMRGILLMWHACIQRSTCGGCPREDATQKEARGRREKERQGTKNDSPDEELLQAWPSFRPDQEGPELVLPKAAGARTRCCWHTGHVKNVWPGLRFQTRKDQPPVFTDIDQIWERKPAHILYTEDKWGLWVWNYQFLCFQRGTTVGSKSAGNQHVPTLLVECLHQSSSLWCLTKMTAWFTRLYFKLDPNRQGDSATHQRVSNEQRCSPSSLQTQSGVMQHKANLVLRQMTTAMLAYMHKENMCLTAHTIW